MKKMSGFVVSEIVTMIIAVVVTIAVAFGMYVSNERDRMVQSAEASIAEIVAQVIATSEDQASITCDNSLVDLAVLENEFLALSITQIQIDMSSPGEGFGPGIYIRSSQKEDGGDTFVTAKRLYEAVSKNDAVAVREIKNDEDEEEIEYSIRILESAICAATEAGS